MYGGVHTEWFCTGNRNTWDCMGMGLAQCEWTITLNNILKTFWRIHTMNQSVPQFYRGLWAHSEKFKTREWFSINLLTKLFVDSRRGKRKERKTITYQETVCTRGTPCRAVSWSNEDDNKIQSQSEERGRCECICMYGYVAFACLHPVKLEKSLNVVKLVLNWKKLPNINDLHGTSLQKDNNHFLHTAWILNLLE